MWTVPIEAVLSGSILFASILKFVSNVRQLFAANDFSRRNFSDAFFLGALRLNNGADTRCRDYFRAKNLKIEGFAQF